jgi:drug/metabolite transporter (DMT)-like permease
MKNKNYFANLFELNLAIFFTSTSGVLGRYIDLPVPFIIFARSVIAGLLLFMYAKAKGFNFNIAKQDKTSFWIGGFILGVHWIFYFYALKYSNVAIAMLSLYTFPIITAILEPLLLKNKLLKIHLFLGVLVILGIYLIVPDFSFSNQYFFGACLGLLSALLYALRNIMLKSKISQYNQSIVMLNQLGIISIFLAPTIFLFDNSNIINYLPSTFLLALLTTAIGHTLFVSSIKKFSITSASLISSLQPVYGILLAFAFLSEVPKTSTIIGGVIILSTVVFESLRLRKLDGEY